MATDTLTARRTERPPLGIPDAPEYLPPGRRDCALVRYADTVRAELEAAHDLLFRLETALRYSFIPDSREALADACRDTRERARTAERAALTLMQETWRSWEPAPGTDNPDAEFDTYAATESAP